MSNSQLPPNPDAFNRTPHRQAYDFILDSKNRDKRLYPDSNYCKIELPDPLKGVRNFHLCHMTVPKIESSQTGKCCVKDQNFSDQNNLLLFNEGIIIHNENNIFSLHSPFAANHPLRFALPRTITEFCASVIYQNNQIKLTTKDSHNFIPGQLVDMVGYPYAKNCAQPTDFNPNRRWKVVEIPGPCQVCLCDPSGSVCTIQDSLGNLPPASQCSRPALVIYPHQNQQEFANFVETYFNYIYRNQDIQSSINYDEFSDQYQIIFFEPSTNNRSQLVLNYLLGNKPVDAITYLSEGDYSPEELAGAISNAMNPPTVIENVNDKFAYSINNVKMEITLMPGTYTADSLIFTIQALLNDSAGTNIFSAEYDSQNGVYIIKSNNIEFNLCFSSYPEFAQLIGFYPIDHVQESCYSSQCQIIYPAYNGDSTACAHFRTKNKYSTYYDKKKDKFCILKNGRIGAPIETIKILDIDSSLITTSSPHGFEKGDLVNVKTLSQSQDFEPGTYTVLSVCSATELTINMKVCQNLQNVGQTLICSIDLPFNLNFTSSSSTQLLGFEKKTLCGQTCYCSTKNCSMWDPPYLLVKIEEIREKLWAQFVPGQGMQEVYARLDCDSDDKVFKLTKCKEAFEDLFIGKTYNISGITVSILTPNGELYDTKKCDWSMWLRMIIEK